MRERLVRGPIVRPFALLGLVGLAALLLPAPVAANEEPTVHVEVTPFPAVLGQQVAFRGNATDPDGFIVNWTWTVQGVPIAYSPNTTYVFTEPGTYAVALTVVDDLGANHTDGVQITFRDEAVAAEPDQYAGLPTWLFWLSPFLVSLVLFSIAYLVILKGVPNIYNQVFFFFYATSALKSLAEALTFLTAEDVPRVATVAQALSRVAAYFFIALFLWFVSVFPRPIVPWLQDGRRGAVVLVLGLPFLGNEVFHFVSLDLASNVFNGYASLVAMTCLALLIYHAWDTDSEEERRRIRLLAATFLLIVLITLADTGLRAIATSHADAGDAATAERYVQFSHVSHFVVGPLVEIIGAMVLMYAILRYQLLGIDRVFVRVTRAGLFALLVPSTFVIISNSIEQLFQDTVLQGVRFDFLIAGFISALLMFPIQKLITFFVYRLFPGADAHDERTLSGQRMEIFEAQLRYSLLDGALKPKEIQVLGRLRASVNLKPDEFKAVLKRFPADQVRPLQASGRGRGRGATA